MGRNLVCVSCECDSEEKAGLGEGWERGLKMFGVLGWKGREGKERKGKGIVYVTNASAVRRNVVVMFG